MYKCTEMQKYKKYKINKNRHPMLVYGIISKSEPKIE